MSSSQNKRRPKSRLYQDLKAMGLLPTSVLARSDSPHAPSSKSVKAAQHMVGALSTKDPARVGRLASKLDMLRKLDTAGAEDDPGASGQPTVG